MTPHMSIVNHFLLFTIFFFLFGFFNFSSVANGNVCQSTKCYEYAEEVKKYMDLNISPCDDFYKFVCNKYHDNKVKTEDLDLPVISTLISLFSEPPSSPKNTPFQKAFNLYEICMGQNPSNKYVRDVIKKVVERLGGWPLTGGDEWREKKWEDITASLSQSGYYEGIFFENFFVTNTQDPYIVVIGKSFVEFKPISYAVRLARWLGADFNDYRELEQAIRNISQHFEDFKPKKRPNITKLTVGQMMARWPSIDWLPYFTSFFEHLPNVTIDINTNVAVTASEVDKVVDFLAETTTKQIMDYVISRIVVELAGYIPFNELTYYFLVRPKATNLTLLERQKYCAAVTIHSLPEMVYSILRVNYIDDKIEDILINVGESMKNKLGVLINQAHLDNGTLQTYRDTLSNITFRAWTYKTIGSSVNQFEDLVLNEQDFGDTLWNIVKFRHNSQFGRVIINGSFVSPLSLTDRDTFTDQVRGYIAQYETDSNHIEFDLAYLLSRSLPNGLPKHSNHIAFNRDIAHELGHSVSYSEITNYEKNSTISNHEQKNVTSNKIDCFKELYDNYIQELNTTITKAHSTVEDVADQIAYKVWHLVYKDWLDVNGEEPQLPNLNYTSMQMFWISLAHDKCDDYSELKWVHEDPEHHSPNRFRINMPLSNNAAFSDAFKCQPGSRMNPVNKCSFW